MVFFEIIYVKVFIDSLKKNFYSRYRYIFSMYLFLVFGFFVAFLAFMKIGSNDFGIKVGKSPQKVNKTL